MKCQRAARLMDTSLDGALNPEEQRALDAHLAGCAGCRREMETSRAVLEMLADVPRRPLSDDFDLRLQARLAEIGPRRSPWPVWSRLWQMNAWRMRPALVPVAAALAAAVVFQVAPQPQVQQATGPERPGYVAQCVREHEAAGRWRGLPEEAVDFNLEVVSAATAAGDLFQ